MVGVDKREGVQLLMCAGEAERGEVEGEGGRNPSARLSCGKRVDELDGHKGMGGDGVEGIVEEEYEDERKREKNESENGDEGQCPPTEEDDVRVMLKRGWEEARTTTGPTAVQHSSSRCTSEGRRVRTAEMEMLLVCCGAVASELVAQVLMVMRAVQTRDKWTRDGDEDQDPSSCNCELGRNRDRDHGYAQGKTGGDIGRQLGMHRIERTRPAFRTARKYNMLRRYANMYSVNMEDGNDEILAHQERIRKPVLGFQPQVNYVDSSQLQRPPRLSIGAQIAHASLLRPASRSANQTTLLPSSQVLLELGTPQWMPYAMRPGMHALTPPGKMGKRAPPVPAMSMFFVYPSIHEPMSICPLPRHASAIITARPRRRAGATPKNWTLEAQITLPSS
ncbi:hypothetical protein CKAH01_03875 [Colletotrichum kahawae]|uniref:Uncharacterized protein n=1 Tax=Colletotrichum kahawae TaxID=34407 RepID=A0AAE0DAZ0_COLKA|nr:hypothetical protein CKAH01_03875 [Colletotrichum kahawae]